MRPLRATITAFGDPRVRGIVLQLVVAGAVLGLGSWLVHNTLDNLERGGISTGFGFLERPANFAVGESLIPYTAADSYARAIVVGLLNTFKVGLAGIVLATLVGIGLGIARLSANWLAATLATAIVEAVRNVPLLLQLFLWYATIQSLPAPRAALEPLPGVFLCNRGILLPVPAAHPAWGWVGLALLAALVATAGLRRWARRRHEATGQPFPLGLVIGGLVLGLPLLAWLAGGAPTRMDVPGLLGFNFRGGVSLSPELLALLLGLTLYTASFIAEIVRGGILAVGRGQSEAAQALGLSRSQTLRLVILPQALRVIVPPLTSQYLNLLKNSSLAVAIGYPDVVSVLDTAINQTGQAIEGVALIMAVFLVISLSISGFMNWYNKRIALIER